MFLRLIGLNIVFCQKHWNGEIMLEYLVQWLAHNYKIDINVSVQFNVKVVLVVLVLQTKSQNTSNSQKSMTDRLICFHFWFAFIICQNTVSGNLCELYRERGKWENAYLIVNLIQSTGQIKIEKVFLCPTWISLCSQFS